MLLRDGRETPTDEEPAVSQEAPAQPTNPSVQVLGENDGVEVVDPDKSGEREAVSQPSKLIRIASMVKNMLDEVRHAPLDEAGRRLLAQIHERSMSELESVLSEDLRAELAEFVLPFAGETPSESELRIAQAQLVGWLEGLFHGIQASLFSQQMAAQQQMEQMRRRALTPGMPQAPGPPGPPGPGSTGYL
jgi:hypothetical protein